MYTQLRGSTYYFRFNIPPQYRHALGWSIVRSLCSCPVISDTIANTLGQNIRKIMSYSLDDITIKQLVDKYIKQTLETIDHYINTREAVSREVAQAGIEVIQLQQTEHEEDLFKRSYKGVDRIVDNLLDGKEVDTPSRNKLSRAVLRSAIDLHDVQISAMEGNPVPVTLENAKEAQSIDTPITPANPLPIPSGMLPGPPLSDFIDEHFSANTGWSIAAVDDYRGCAKTAVKILGDIPVGTITRAIMVEYRATLLRVPTFWASRHTKASVDDLPIPGVPTIAKATIEKNLTYLNSLMNYAVDCGHLKDSPMPKSRMSIPDNKIDVHSFSADQLKTILNTTREFKGHQYWIPRLALYTGCRLNELCQLHKTDLKNKKGVWYLDINDDGKKTLKNKASKRLIPLHPVILELGFIEYAQGIEHHRLFPGCKYTPARGKYGNGFGKWFSRVVLVDTGIKESHDRSITFHSFRHGFVTALKRLKADHLIVGQLAGHAAQGTTDKEYFDGHLLPDLKEGIDRLPDHRNTGE